MTKQRYWTDGIPISKPSVYGAYRSEKITGVWGIVQMTAFGSKADDQKCVIQRLANVRFRPLAAAEFADFGDVRR